MPELSVGRVDFGNVAEQADAVNITENLILLEVTQAVQEQLQQQEVVKDILFFYGNKNWNRAIGWYYRSDISQTDETA